MLVALEHAERVDSRFRHAPVRRASGEDACRRTESPRERARKSGDRGGGFPSFAGRRRRSRSDEALSGTGRTIAGIEDSWPHGRRAIPSASGGHRIPGSEVSRTPVSAPGGSKPCNEAGPAGSARPSAFPEEIDPPLLLSHKVPKST